jgi:hypothetical protein
MLSEKNLKMEDAVVPERSIDRLTTLVGEVSGWGDRANITFRREIVAYENGRMLNPHRYYVAASVEICGSGSTISAHGHDHCAALAALLQNIERHYRDLLTVYKQRCLRAREILDEHGINYVKGEL